MLTLNRTTRPMRCFHAGLLASMLLVATVAQGASSRSSSTSTSHKSRDPHGSSSSTLTSTTLLGDGSSPLQQQQQQQSGSSSLMTGSSTLPQQHHRHQRHQFHQHHHQQQQRGKNRDMVALTSDLDLEDILESGSARSSTSTQLAGGGSAEQKNVATDIGTVSVRHSSSRERNNGSGGGGGGVDLVGEDRGNRNYIPSNCSRCRVLEETINLTKEAIKQQILSKLGFKQPPNITGRALLRIPPLNHLLDMYGMQSDAPSHAFRPGPVFEEAEDDYHAKTEKVISFAQQPPTSWSPPTNMEVLYFKFSHSVMVNKVVRANLWVYLNPSKAVQDTGTLVHVFKVSRTEDSSNTVLTHVLSPKVDIKPRRGGWVAVEIRKLVFDWFRHPHNNLGIVVQAFDQDGLQLVANNPQSDTDTSLVPFVEVYTMDESKRRTKRMIGLNCDENSNEVRCCRYPLTVDFEEFGWDWIIAPKKYEANYCSGECPFVFLQKYPHTHLVQQAKPSGSAGPCCSPRKLSSISMLHFDNEYNIIYSLLPGMVVDRCSCS